ncbi:hypothetical protein FHX81_6153 [Saccharothrix saharensis]|uniref:Uncharacterized protein n=1 Tax=Saccharothrix saharensis TaxID=571190 RepID=A0A543JLJ6_9PSEU|nr:hypothetical protein [Saccharothrix saharensis]TQM83726.1 hypothetical protein FHX81_6153 [Saccharothrix saharensis]
MPALTANENVRLLFWARVREFAVPPSMIETATARRTAGDWAGACAAARVDVDLDLRAVRRAHGRWGAERVRDDVRHLAPDLLRWHFPRIAPDGLVRPGVTVPLARYDLPSVAGDVSVHLVARTPPAWADGGQRISLALWERSRPGPHPHPRPDRRFRLDLHRHLWDVRRVGELAERSGAGRRPAGDDPAVDPRWGGFAVDRWGPEASLLLRAEGRAAGEVDVRLGGKRRLVLEVGERGEARVVAARPGGRPLPVLPEAATSVLPDLELLRAGLIDADRLHPLVASALVPDHRAARAGRGRDGPGTVRLVECRGVTHRIGVVDGVLVPLDHDPDEIGREELLVALGGTPLPCLRAIDDAHRRPESLVDVRALLDHGDTAGALAVVEGLLGPDAVLRDGMVRDELEAARDRRVAHGLYRAGLVGLGPGPAARDGHRRTRNRPRHATDR